MKYPTREGIAIPIRELDLPVCRESERSKQNNHHLEFTRRRMGQFLITQTLRDLLDLQEVMPVVTHNILHDRYQPPEFPTIEQAMTRLDDAFYNQETLKIRYPGGYYTSVITRDHWLDLNKEYRELK